MLRLAGFNSLLRKIANEKAEPSPCAGTQNQSTDLFRFGCLESLQLVRQLSETARGRINLACDLCQAKRVVETLLLDDQVHIAKHRFRTARIKRERLPEGEIRFL